MGLSPPAAGTGKVWFNWFHLTDYGSFFDQTGFEKGLYLISFREICENSKLCSESLVTGFYWGAPITPAVMDT